LPHGQSLALAHDAPTLQEVAPVVEAPDEPPLELLPLELPPSPACASAGSASHSAPATPSSFAIDCMKA
jgi:hypothetical protein